MRPSLTSQELDQLGIAAAVIGDGEVVVFPADRVARGRGPRPAAADLPALVETRFAGLRFAEARLGVLERSGLRLELLHDRRTIAKLILSQESSGTVRALSATDAVLVDPDDPATRYVDFERGGPLLVATADRAAVLLVPEDDRIVAFPVLWARLRIQPLAAIESDLARWCADCDDAWLVEQIRARALDDPWQHAVAVGLFLRGAVPASRAGRREAVQRLLEGAVDAAEVAPRRWARGLGEAQRRTLEDLALAEVDALQARIEELREHMDCADPAWRRALTALCLARDDLQGVRLILIEADYAARLDAALGDLDDEGAALLWSLPRAIRSDDERLRRAARREPVTWWTELAVEGETA